MAKPARQYTTRPLEYHQRPWGDLIYGTREQLRGIGIDLAPPRAGTKSACRRRPSVTDPRGFKCLIETCNERGQGIFCASIALPGREQPEPPFEDVARGVRRQKNIWTDDYAGTAAALAAAGLIRLDQLPGQPGMGKVIVTILPDGSLPKGTPNVKDARAKEAGAKRIRRVSKTSYQVSVLIDADKRSRRCAAYVRSRKAWEQQMRSTPRPAPLHVQLLTCARHDEAPPPAAYSTIGNVIYLPQH